MEGGICTLHTVPLITRRKGLQWDMLQPSSPVLSVNDGEYEQGLPTGLDSSITFSSDWGLIAGCSRHCSREEGALGEWWWWFIRDEVVAGRKVGTAWTRLVMGWLAERSFFAGGGESGSCADDWRSDESFSGNELRFLLKVLRVPSGSGLLWELGYMATGANRLLNGGLLLVEVAVHVVVIAAGARLELMWLVVLASGGAVLADGMNTIFCCGSAKAACGTKKVVVALAGTGP